MYTQSTSATYFQGPRTQLSKPQPLRSCCPPCSPDIFVKCKYQNRNGVFEQTRDKMFIC